MRFGMFCRFEQKLLFLNNFLLIFTVSLLILSHICNIIEVQMNLKKALEMFLDTMSSFSFHPKFMEELYNLLKTDLKGKEVPFFKCLTTQLNYIKNLGVMVHNADGHEIIHGFDGHFYSIHLQQSQFNVRFLVHIDDMGTPIFLCAFYERSGHNKTSYADYTDVLLERFEYMMKGDEADE